VLEGVPNPGSTEFLENINAGRVRSSARVTEITRATDPPRFEGNEVGRGFFKLLLQLESIWEPQVSGDLGLRIDETRFNEENT